MTGQWRKSTYSYHTNCVEVAGTRHAIQVRDSKDPDGEPVTVSRAAWARLLDAL